MTPPRHGWPFAQPCNCWTLSIVVVVVVAAAVAAAAAAAARRARLSCDDWERDEDQHRKWLFLAKGTPDPRPPAVAVAPANRKKAALRKNPKARRAYDKERTEMRFQQRMREWAVQRTLDVGALRRAINSGIVLGIISDPASPNLVFAHLSSKKQLLLQNKLLTPAQMQDTLTKAEALQFVCVPLSPVAVSTHAKCLHRERYVLTPCCKFYCPSRSVVCWICLLPGT